MKSGTDLVNCGLVEGKERKGKKRKKKQKRKEEEYTRIGQL